MSDLDDATQWLGQARSDARAAAAIAKGGSPLDPGDLGCHIALLCAQALEKCVKGCMLLVGQTPTATHAVEKDIDSLLRAASGYRSGAPQFGLRDAYRASGVRRITKQLLDWTPGNAKSDELNYEYPWRVTRAAELATPFGHPAFEDPSDHREWVRVTTTLVEHAAKIASASRRGRSVST